VNTGRCSGILLHVTSLPSRFGIGDLGPESRNFVDFLAEARQKFWCVLPLGPTGTENSPYQCRSAFAGNPLLLSLEHLVDRGYISQNDLSDAPQFSSVRVLYPAVQRYKESILKKAFHGFSETDEYHNFEQQHAWWLDCYALYMALLEANNGAPWTQFDPAITPSPDSIHYFKFIQFEFDHQWRQLRNYCAERSISIMGDMPFYVEHDSADVWSNRELFDLRQDGEPELVGGVPPDYFSQHGQLWGNPTYRWDKLEETQFKWWVDRFRANLQRVDLLRLDHFRGFEAFWSVPAGETTARNGRWIPGPGARLFERVLHELGPAPFVAENLGTITPQVEDLRRRFNFPGMAVLQFGFGDEPGPHRPTNFVRDLVSFTGTHDNDTTKGWWKALRRAAQDNEHSAESRTIHRVKSYIQNDGREIHWSFIQAIFTSVAELAIVPMQDVLGLGSEARMNLPGRAKGNWDWRLQSRQMTRATLERLRDLTAVSGR
jgi:4-alpha-glucanotransferase